jgi:hypothetical protein
MESYPSEDVVISLEKKGAREFSKVSYPIRYGLFSEIRTSDFIFQFNRNGEIKYLQGRGRTWPHPAEWLKRTVANDWIYYSAGDYKGVFEVTGEYYFPCLSYPSNSIFSENPFENEAVTSAIQSWPSRLRTYRPHSLSVDLKSFLNDVRANGAEVLKLKAQRLHRALGRRVTVLPPDTRHVDYEVIPLMVADGCLYNCGFCRVKSGHDFAPRARENILNQIIHLKQFYDRDLVNYNSLFLGEHDALRAGREILAFAVENAYRLFEFEKSVMKGPRLFLFGSADSLIEAKESLWGWMKGLPLFTTINVGLESGDPATLTLLKKPISAQKVREAFEKMLDINRKYNNIEVTANFVFGEDLPESHLPSLFELVEGRIDPLSLKGALYLSPLIGVKKKKEGSGSRILRHFKRVKAQSPLPTYIYLIQRL